ncbi:hypothetical protein K493DRAFT_309736 [Basidiobolus meristosporus CBS 931.73]|uniref:Uncharacterized protein n=1 Tax=Basidiobolus meristosporus CBS 931.73 TaxID=1314790 RepID=A0A1Y1VRY9_9FUNG|nr:hypothetical protein K493DRAFT_309736 [Basidiobolus meristosporus CBS 931.73]|eukprot:ORX63534.1 hypothetical protein K493DRAFT_309736 [Basidiobolus meristosporus CBS 931.73]
MVYLTPCTVANATGATMEAQCESQFGSLILDDRWTGIATAIVSVARPLSVALIGTAVWNLWWLTRRRSMEKTGLCGSSWSIATAMTHIPGIFTLLGSIWRVHNLGVTKETKSLIGILILIGMMLPLISLLWAAYVIEVGDVPYQLTQVIHFGQEYLPNAVEKRAPLLMSMNDIVYNEKPLLGYDILKNHPLGMQSAELKPVEAHWRWWKLKVFPLERSCMVYKAVVTDEILDVTPSVSFGDDTIDIVQEETIQKCSSLSPVLEFIGSSLVMADNSPYNMKDIENLQLQENTNRLCHVQYSCRVNATSTRWEIFTNTKGEVNWYNEKGAYDPQSVKGLMSFLQDRAKLKDYAMNTWLMCWMDWTGNATRITKEAAMFKYDMHLSLGRYKPAHMTLQETLGEFTREATLQQAKNATVIYSGQVYKFQLSLIAGISWLVAVMLALMALLLAHLKSRNDCLLHRFLDLWQVVGSVFLTRKEITLGDEQNYHNWPIKCADQDQDNSPVIH